MSESSRPPKGQDGIRDQFWNEQAAAGWGTGERAQPSKFVTDFFQAYSKELGEQPRVLDIGCGAGRHLVFFAQQGADVVGIEPTSGMRERASEALAVSGQKAEIIGGESSALPFPDANFDLAVSIGVSHHGNWENAQRDIAEASRVLKPGRYLLLQVRSVNDTTATREQIVDSVGYTATDLDGEKKGITHHYFTEEELIQLGLENGMEVVGKPTEVVRATEKDASKQTARLRVVYRKKT